MAPQGRIVREGSLYLLQFINLVATLVKKNYSKQAGSEKSKKYSLVNFFSATGQLETTGST